MARGPVHPMLSPTGHRTLTRLAISLAGCSAVTLLFAPASGAVTIGAPLNLPANVEGGRGCGVIFSVIGPPPSCTFLGNDSAGAWTSQVPRGEWVITLTRVRTGPRVGPMVFTVIRATRSQAGPVRSSAATRRSRARCSRRRPTA